MYEGRTSSGKSSGSANGGCSSPCFLLSSWPWKKFYSTAQASQQHARSFRIYV